MMCQRPGILLLASFVALAPAPSVTDAQVDSKLVSATVELPPGEATAIVQLRNEAALPIEAWQIRLTYDVGAGTLIHLDVTTDGYLSLARRTAVPGFGPIPPGSTRVTKLVLGGIPASAAVTVRMVVFGDLSSAGDEDEVRAVFSKREAEAAEMEAWATVLQAAVRKPIDQARSFLTAKLESLEATGPRDRSSAAKGVQQRVAELVGSATSEAELREQLVDEIQRLRRTAAIALRHKAKNL